MTLIPSDCRRRMLDQLELSAKNFQSDKTVGSPIPTFFTLLAAMSC
ncbi:predicted protein [Plenodomus lingam JN3]|uniref:Predicted protein n=1 Tax=Leptosphaeria maculans (strain JN3 / isolate v23.1.3 / race Av1-4-5-6-7-8) TaxID=985895 RepID=E5AB72_LEPMJ|nr:predicted protein [Plenodomus lingam JN3]CBY00913.1 predicted protein [Plenodomus lingam JN3]